MNTTDISPTQARTLIDITPDLLIVDVRTPEEFADGHIKNAINHPLSRLTSGDIDGLDPARPLLVYCHSGARSAHAVHILSSHGFSQLSELTSGITAWLRAGLPITR